MDGLDQFTPPTVPPIAMAPVKNRPTMKAAAESVRDQSQNSGLKGANRTRDALTSRDLATRYLQLEEASRMKSAFLADMSHELRTPLNAIIGFSEMLDDGSLGELSAPQKEAVNDIVTSGNHLLALVNDILDLSRVEAGKMTLEPDALHVATLVRAGLHAVRELALTRKLRLVPNIAEDLGNVWLDGRKAKQILYNLLSNAIKFTPDGGEITVTARRIQRQALPGGPFEPYFELGVSDTGIGISADDQTRLFKPFTQIDNTLARRYQGTGLGLAMVKQLAQLHGGAVSVESTPDKGSTFTVWLPWRSAEELPVELDAMPVAVPIRETPAVRAAAAQTPREREGRTVLVVDDDAKAIKLFAAHLESTGYRILTACSWQDGLDLARSKLPDLIVLDLMMPEVNGFEVVEALKRDPSTSGIPVVIVTAKQVTAEDRARLGADVLKVIEKSDLKQGRLVREITQAMADLQA